MPKLYVQYNMILMKIKDDPDQVLSIKLKYNKIINHQYLIFKRKKKTLKIKLIMLAFVSLINI